MNSAELYAFLSDPKLVELIEQNKTTDDLLDVIKLNENQSSEVLRWCMNPNEGHSQGDAVIKDFLEAAYFASVNAIRDNKIFFEEWTPGKIRTSSFGAAFVTREFNVKVDDGTKKGRLDLFLVDPQNKLLITIEHKAGADLNAEQLDKYVGAVRKEVLSRSAFKDWGVAFVALDKHLKEYSEEYLAGLGKRWALLDYGWLKASAERAGFQLARGNSAARLLVAYCQKQVDWESVAQQRISELATDLALAHPVVIDAIGKLGKTSLLHWTPATLEGVVGELILFRAQHSEICERLTGIQSIAVIVDQVKRSLTRLGKDDFETGKTWLAAMPRAAQKWMWTSEDALWPMNVNLYRDSKASDAHHPRFNLRFFWSCVNFSTAVEEPALRLHFSSVFPDLIKYATTNDRWVIIAKDLSLNEAVKETVRLLDTIDELIKTYPRRVQ